MSSSASTSATSLTRKLTPNLDENSTKMLNLTVLQRIDPFIEEILITAAHVTLYEFNIDLNQWSRKDVEGSLFVVKRNSQPRFQFIVMNRRNTENLVEDLLGDFEYEVQVPYLLYRNPAQEVNGIWFYNSRECDDVANLFSRILSAYSKVPPKAQVTSSKRYERILHHLSRLPGGKTQEVKLEKDFDEERGKKYSDKKLLNEFEELEAVPTSAVIEGPLEPSVTAVASAVRPEDSSFINFFSEAMKTGNSSSNDVNSGQLYRNPAPSAPLSPVYSATISHTPNLQVPPFPVSSPAGPLLTIGDGSESINNSNRIANLVKPSTFYTPPSSSPLLVPPISSSSSTSSPHPLFNLQRPHGTPMLQPFPPPSPPASLTANPSPAADYGPVNREKVQDALLMLVQDNRFVDMVYQALVKVHQP